VSLAAEHGRVLELRAPLPWTIVLIEIQRERRRRVRRARQRAPGSG